MLCFVISNLESTRFESIAKRSISKNICKYTQIMYRHHVCLLLCFLPDYKSTELRSCSFLFNPKLIKNIQIDNSKYIVLTQEVIFYRFFFSLQFFVCWLCCPYHGFLHFTSGLKYLKIVILTFISNDQSSSNKMNAYKKGLTSLLMVLFFTLGYVEFRSNYFAFQ